MLCYSSRVVYDYAKILNLKQFTTIPEENAILNGCLWLCKDTKFKAIHNQIMFWMATCHVVYDYAKILNLKQFTTYVSKIKQRFMLSMTMQRY